MGDRYVTPLGGIESRKGRPLLHSSRQNLAFLHRTMIARRHSKLLNKIPIERELVVVLLAINIFWGTADVRNFFEL